MVSVDYFPPEEGGRKSSPDHQTMSSLAVAKLSMVRVDERRKTASRPAEN
jgi:hypothetical protein